MALTDNLISYWALDEVSGTRADSVVATANTLTDNNTVTSNTGKVYALASEYTLANSEFLSHTDNASLSVGGTAFSITAWIFLRSGSLATFPMIATKGNANREYLLYYDTSALAFACETYTATGNAGGVILQVSTGGAITGNTWYFVAFTSDQTNNKISFNAGTQSSAGAVNAGWDGGGPFQIGALNSASFWDGRLGPIAFWKRALSGAEITTLYNAGNGLTYAQMQSNWGKLLGQELNRLVVP